MGFGTKQRWSAWSTTIVTVAAGLVAIAWLSFRDVRSADQDAEALMRAQALSIADLVGESGLHGFEVYRRWEDEVAARLLDNARWLARRDSVRPLSDAELGSYAQMHHISRINLFDAHGDKVGTSVVESVDSGLVARHDPRDFFGPVLRGETRELRIGFKPARFRGGSRFAVAVARRGGGVLVVNVFADSMRAVLRDVQPAHLLAALGAADGVRYVVLQRGDSVIASAPESAGAVPAAASGSRPSAGEVRVREIATPGGSVYELSKRVGDRSSGELDLRVGLDARPLDRARTAAMQRGWVRTLVFLLVVLLWSIYLMQRDREGRLAAEVARIRSELEQHEREAQRHARLVAMGELAAHVAHEVRNPLNTIHLTAQQLTREPQLAGTLRERVEDIRIESRRIEDIVKGFLDFARPRRPQPHALDLREALAVAARAAASLGRDRGVVVEVSGDPAPAELDPVMVAEVFDNLLRNAVEASPEGGRVRGRLSREGGLYRVDIEDEGTGVPESQRERIFDPYFSTKPSGTGLGLSIVAQLVSTMGGTVRVEDAARGARFVVRFPTEVPPA